MEGVLVDLSQILIADNEEAFLRSTTDLLQREGYQCDCAPSAAEAAQKLGANDYVLLIADTKLPGNSGLELIRNLPNIAEGVPVILVTGHPSLPLAIQSIELRVQAYLIKPLDFNELLKHVHIAVERFQVYRSVHNMKQGLQYWYKGLGDIEELLRYENQEAFPVSFDTFLDLTFQNIVGALADLKYLTRALAMHDGRKEPCHLFSCPALKSLTDGLTETIDILEKSKSAFKSKTLGEVRKKLNGLVNNKA